MIFSEIEDAEGCPHFDDNNRKKTPRRPWITKSSERGRPRKQFREGTTYSNSDIVLLSEILMKSALSSLGTNKWRAAMFEELTPITRNDT